MLTPNDVQKLQANQAKTILTEWAKQQVNWKYHLKWIDRLDMSSNEKLVTSYKDLAPNSCLEATSKRILFLLT